MCGRFDLTASIKELRQEFGGVPLGELAPRYNIPPSEPILTIRNESAVGRRWVMVQWGIIPPWNPKEKPLINSKEETIGERPSFKKLLEFQRCLVPATGFFEWQELDSKTKQPYRILLKTKQPFAFAGIYANQQDPKTGMPIETVAIITTRPNKLMADIHDRMPVILRPQDHETWLNQSNRDIQPGGSLRALLRPYATQSMIAYRVRPLVNSSKDDVPACIEPLPDDERPKVQRSFV